MNDDYDHNEDDHDHDEDTHTHTHTHTHTRTDTHTHTQTPGSSRWRQWGDILTFKVYLKRFIYFQLTFCPSQSSTYSSCCERRSSDMRVTCRAHATGVFLETVCTFGVLAFVRTSEFGTMFCHRIIRSLRCRQLMWSYLACLLYIAQVSKQTGGW